MSSNRNSYVVLKNYNKQIESFVNNNNYERQNTSYPKNIQINTSAVLSNYNSSGVVATNPAYNVAEENPGLSWNQNFLLYNSYV